MFKCYIKTTYKEYKLSLQQELEEDFYRDVLISFEVNAQANRLLTEAAERASRTKRQEAKIRLHDHLIKYQSISEINKAYKKG